MEKSLSCGLATQPECAALPRVHVNGQGAIRSGSQTVVPSGETCQKDGPHQTVTLEANGRKLTQKAQIVKTQGWSLGPNPQVIRQLKGSSAP